MKIGNPAAMRHGFRTANVEWEQFQTMVDAMPDCVVAIDELGSIIATNQEAQHRLGYRADELLGRSVEVLLPGAMKHEHRVLREQYVVNPHARPMGAGRNLAARCADGSELPVDISLSPLVIGECKVVLAAMRDVTERRAAEASIRRLNDELEERVQRRTAELEVANRQLEAYSYTVSHELRAPLRLVRGFGRLLSEELAGIDHEGARSHLRQITEAAQRMNQIVEGLLALARLDHHQLSCAQIDMTALTQSVVDELRSVDQASTVDFFVGTLPAISGDTVLLHQVLSNLLSNAVKFCGTRPSTMITVRGHSEPGRCIYQVQDNGPGFDGKLAAKIFDPFQRLDDADAFEGLGIGLTLARRIVERHAGRIWAEGHTGGGATFSFWLPSN